MRRFGLIGNPISHSRSPQLFAAAYPDGKMSYELIECDSFEMAIGRFERDFEAVNVTSPYKEKAFGISDFQDPVASRLRAANLLVRWNGGIKAYNTDYYAVCEILRRISEFCGRPEDIRVLAVGCGGAGMAAALAAADLGMGVTVANRTVSKAEAFCASVKGAEAVGISEVSAISRECDILVYALPVRMEGLGSLSLEGKTVIEAGYRSPCLRDLCKSCGANYVSGEEWLVEQAIAGFETMTGKSPDVKAMKALLQQQ